MKDNETHPLRIAINKVVTKTGDQGKTALVGGQRVAKSSLRLEVYGTVDELNAQVGMLYTHPELQGQSELLQDLLELQHLLFHLGSLLATLPEDLHPQQPRVRASHIEWLEHRIGTLNLVLEDLRSFVLPGGSPGAAACHVARTVTRRAERWLQRLIDQEGPEALEEALIFLNRLSDYFFVASRYLLQRQGIPEFLWDPKAGNPG